ncbi:alpha/beta hydrolase [Chitinophaga solisilvae]|uniref:Esterase family protein n=1 Tax=Chitinophaga solisilvae TaxID=1233460 RepID=A0A3S1B290_9BACT|nr:alpha/beta hydrolase family protein [Chitinophaga solisilvae]NSL90474.1 esterase family protein [Chitinophaga solisilvae]
MKKLVLFFLLAGSLATAKAADADTISIPSAAMGRSYRCVIITPASYKSGTQRYPVIYLLHGHGGNYANWITKVPSLRELADAYQLMIVCPDGATGSWYLDSPVDSSMRFETYVGKEVPAYIDQHYQTLPEPRYRAITGLSMGGHGALFLAVRHPETFGAAGSISGGVDFRMFPKSWDLIRRLGEPGKNGTNWTGYTVIGQAERFTSRNMPLIIDCGVKDFFIDVNRALHQKLLELGVPHDYTERPGEHNWTYWSNSIQYQCLFFHRFFEQ